MPKGIPIGLEMAKKFTHRHANTQTFSYLYKQRCWKYLSFINKNISISFYRIELQNSYKLDSPELRKILDEKIKSVEKSHQAELVNHREKSVLRLSQTHPFGTEVGQIGPKWDKSGEFSDQKGSEPKYIEI